MEAVDIVLAKFLEMKEQEEDDEEGGEGEGNSPIHEQQNNM